MVEIIRAGTRENPLSVGGHWQLVNVGWPSGPVYVVVTARTFYVDGAGNSTTDAPTTAGSGSRTGEIILNAAGLTARAQVVASKNFHLPEELAPAPPVDPHAPLSQFIAVLKLPRIPNNDTSSGGVFSLKLTGSLKVTDPLHPVAGGEPFCGTTTVTGVWGPFYSEPIPGSNAINIFQDVTWTTSTPAGAEIISFTNGPLAGLRVEDVGNGAHSISATSTSIWYQDTFGNLINTNRPCSELPAPGGPTTPATKTSGWKLIQVMVFPVKDYAVLPVEQWTAFTGVEEIITPTSAAAYGGPFWQASITELVVGQNGDFQPIFDDLPAAEYAFRVENVSFTQFEPQVPPQRALTRNWFLPGAYPLSPEPARYDFLIGTNTPPPFNVHFTLPLYEGTTKPPFVPGAAPPSNQSFTS